MRFKLNWASLVVGSKFTVFALFYFVFEGYFPSTSPGRGDLTEGFLHYQFGGLIFGGAYTWRGFFLEFFGNSLAGCPLQIQILLRSSWVSTYGNVYCCMLVKLCQ